MTSDTILETRRVGLQHILKLGEIKFWPGTPSPYPLMEVNHHHLKLKKSRLRDENFFHEKFLPDNFFVHRVNIQAKIGQNWRKFGLMTTTFVWRFFDILSHILTLIWYGCLSTGYNQPGIESMEIDGYQNAYVKQVSSIRTSLVSRDGALKWYTFRWILQDRDSVNIFEGMCNPFYLLIWRQSHQKQIKISCHEGENHRNQDNVTIRWGQARRYRELGGYSPPLFL